MAEKETTEKIIADLDEMHYDMQEIANRAMENLGGNREYRNLLDRYDRAVRSRQYVQQAQLSAKIDLMKRQEMQRLIELEESRRKDVNTLARMLKRINHADHDRYQELLAALSLLLDMTDNVFFDINEVLKRNNLGIEMDNFPELKAAKKTAQDMAIKEQYAMARYKEDLWNEESERIYKYLLERCATYRRKVDRIEARQEKKDHKD